MKQMTRDSERFDAVLTKIVNVIHSVTPFDDVESFKASVTAITFDDTDGANIVTLQTQQD